MRCINQNHPDFIDLLRKTGSNPKILAAQVSVWMDENNTDNIPSTKDIGLNYTVKTSPELYRKYNLLNKDGSLKKLSKEVADKWVNTNNQTSKYIFKVVKTTPDTYSIVIQDNYSNLSKPQKNTIDKIVEEANNIENEGNYTTNEEGDIIIKNEILGLPNELSDPEIIQGPIDYSQESKFRKNNPNFDSERYVNDRGKFGKIEAPLDESLTPFLSETREKAQQYSAEFIADSFKLKDKPNERKFNRPTNLPEGFRLVWGEVDSNKFNTLATDELSGILRWTRRVDGQNSNQPNIPFVKGVMGRDAKSIYSENGGNDVDTKTRYGILRVIQSINDSDVLLGVFRRLGMGEIRVINNKRLNSLFVHNGSLYINEAKWSENLQDKFNKGINLDEYIDVAVFEELIHLIVGKLTNNKTILEASEELDDNDKSIINKFYLDKNPQQFFSSDLKPLQTINELIRMKVQKDLAGISTEDIANSSFTKDSFINDIVNKIWDFIMSLFKDKLVKTNKIAEEVKDYIKGLDIKQVSSELDEILGLAAQRQNEINYGLKATQILSSDRAKQVFEKGEKFDWGLNKILSELQIPKPQKELIKSFNTEDREKIIANLLANYSYTVEINTAKGYKDPESITENFARDGNFNYSREISYQTGNYIYKKIDVTKAYLQPDGTYYNGEIITKEEFDKILRKYNETPNSQHYSNLTVPGGTNYTENEIATPAITPSIKGHAQFATDKGIGWFRSDEQVINTENKETNNKRIDNRIEQLQKEGKTLSEIRVILTKENEEKFGKTKTRRILEVQSDLFQKGRDKDILTGKIPDWEIKKDNNELPFYILEKGSNEIIERFKTKEEAEDTIHGGFKERFSKENQFLQLLNKDNNWVTFFIKSIIQDSAKKGYEKVLFPSGNTASKVEGHDTLEEFKKQKEDRIKYLQDNNLELIEEGLANPESKYIEDFQGYVAGFDGISHGDKETFIEILKTQKDKINTEINQLKQELERVETEGFGALKPIYNFYENTVTNILKKNYIVKQVTDEYGNTWNEIEIKQDFFNDIVLGLPNSNQNTQQQLVDKIKSVDEQIEKKQSENLLDENGNPKDAYFYKGREILNRVTDKAKKVYENVFRNKDLTKTEFEKLKQETFAEYGTKAHSDIEHIISQLTDKDGKFIDTPFDNSYKPLTNKKIYKALFDNLKERMQTYPNAVFLSEIKVLDEDKVVDGKKGIAGTIDLLIIKEDGSIQILDWKFIDLNTDKYEDVPWFKKKAYDVQIGEYRRILSEKYGIPLSSIKGAAIPIKTKYEYKQETKDGVKPPPILRKIEIGNVNVNLEDKDYLLPVTLSTQSTGSKELDKYISKLNNLKQNIENREVSSDEQRMGKAEQLQVLDKAIRHLSVKHSIQPLINQANTFTKDVENVINTFNNNYKDLNFEQSLINNRDEFKTELNEYGIQLDKALAEISIYTELDVDLQPLFGTDISQETKETIEELSKITSNARFLQKALVEVINEFGEKVGESIGYKGITDAEVQVSMDARLFKETSKIPIKTLRVFYEFRREAQNLAEQQTLQENEELTSILKDYEEMAKSKGLTIKNMFSLVMNYAENKLIDQYKREFYNTANDKIKQKDYKWIKENVDVEKYEEAIKKRLEQEINFIDKKNISEQDKNTQILKKKKEYDLSRTDSPGWFIHPSILKAFPQDKWISEEWETMQSTPAAKRLYEWIRNINKKAEEVGYIPQGSAARTFLPFVVKSYMEKMVFGGSLTLGEEFLRSITIDEDTIGYGNIDPLTNKPINKIPKYFTRATDKELSTNLIKNLAIYNQALNNYKFVSQTEGIGLALSRLEQNKEVILTNQWGKAFYDKETDTFKAGKNVQNAELFEKQLATLLYGQKYVQSESFDQLLGSVGKLGEKINAKLGFKLLPENFEDKQISMNKSLDTLNTYFQQKTLGLNPLTALSNLIGGKLQLTIGAGKYITKKDLIKAEWDVDSSRVTEEGKKIIAALKYFQPFTSNEQNKDLIKKLSVTKLTETNIQELLMSMMRGSDLWVQSTIFASLWNNAVLIDGKVHNARDYIRTKTDYKNRYTQGNLQEQEAKFNELVEDLLKQHGIKNKAKLNSEGELYIEELTPNNIESFKLKNLTQALTKRVTGNLNPSEVRSINQNVYTNSFMVFKNWIPSLMSVRFAKLNYSSDVEAFEWGRARTVARIMSREGIKSLSSLVDLLTFNTFSLSDTGKIVKGTPEGLKTLQELYEFKKQQVYQQTGQKLELDKNEFYDLVRQNIRNQAKDTLVTLSLLSMFFALKAVPDDDEDENVKNYHKFMVRTLDKISDEVSFYYSPTSFQTILNGSVMPSIGVFSDGIKVIQKALTELYAVTTGDDELQEKNYVLKYIFKSFPVSSQMSSYLPLYAPDLAKELGITFTNQSRR